MHAWKFIALPILIAAGLSIPSSAAAQVSVNIGAEQVCPYGYYDVAPYNCAPYGTMDPSGSPAVCSSEPAPGSTAPTTFTATSITASIHVTDTLVHIRNVETNPSITSAETKCVMDAVTRRVEATARPVASQVLSWSDDLALN